MNLIHDNATRKLEERLTVLIELDWREQITSKFQIIGIKLLELNIKLTAFIARNW